MSPSQILRATLFHVPRNPFREPGALEFFEDGALLVTGGRIAACGDYASISRQHPEVGVRDFRGGVLLPGFVDTHVHYPQVRILGSLGSGLLEWLQRYTLPEEAKFSNVEYARVIAAEFVRSLAAHGTTTALVFGSHFAESTAALFEAAQSAGIRMVSGMVLSDRRLLPELHQSPESAYHHSTRLIREFHGAGRMLYAVTPRFALSCSDAMLDVCATLMRENPGVRFQTHLNESAQEVAEVARLFPGDSNYFAVYERHDLAGPHSVFAHSVQTTDAELDRMAAHGSSVAHCPCSNAALGSGIFPCRRHLVHGVHFALGSDVGGGTGFGMLKEGLQAYLLQRLALEGCPLSAEHLLYLATRAGAEALGLESETGDFAVGKSADLVYLHAPGTSSLASVARNAPSAEHLLSAIFTLADEACIREVWGGRLPGEVMTIAEVNALPQGEFVAAFGWVFEDSPWVAEQAWPRRPFADRDTLHRVMVSTVEAADRETKVALLRAHPDLGARARMSDASIGEQTGAGLDRMSAVDYERLHAMNRSYREKFGFPFLFAVKGSTVQDILSALEHRVEAAPELEFQEALTQVYRIASFRLQDALGD